MQPEIDTLNDSERQLFDGFTFLLGIFLGGIAATGLGLAARLMDDSAADMQEESDAEETAALIAPIGRIALIGDAELAAAAVAMTAAPMPVDTVLSGPQVFNEACYLCHAPPGVPGAPVVGDGAQWGARVAQGIDVLYEHAIVGYTGEAGYMPAKGGRVDLSDDEVAAAVDYMLEQLP